MIIVKSSGDLSNTENFLKRIQRKIFLNNLAVYAQEGVEALMAATPVDTGKTASSWSYTLRALKNSYVIEWSNSNVNKGVPIALVIQYGHALPNGTYIEGIDYINPALAPIFKKISEDIWREVTNK